MDVLERRIAVLAAMVFLMYIVWEIDRSRVSEMRAELDELGEEVRNQNNQDNLIKENVNSIGDHLIILENNLNGIMTRLQKRLAKKSS
jgi:hypothetical protein